MYHSALEGPLTEEWDGGPSGIWDLHVDLLRKDGDSGVRHQKFLEDLKQITIPPPILIFWGGARECTFIIL